MLFFLVLFGLVLLAGQGCAAHARPEVGCLRAVRAPDAPCRVLHPP